MANALADRSAFFFSSRRRHTRCLSDWSSDVCSSDLFDLSSESRRPAHLDGAHDASLRCGHRRTVLISIVLAVAAEDVRHFQLRAIHSPELRKTEESKAWDQRRLYEARGRVDLMSNRPCWWRSSGIVRSSQDCGGREVVGYFEHLCPIQAGGPRIHGAENEV